MFFINNRNYTNYLSNDEGKVFMSNRLKGLKGLIVRMLIVVLLIPMIPAFSGGKAEAASTYVWEKFSIAQVPIYKSSYIGTNSLDYIDTQNTKYSNVLVDPKTGVLTGVGGFTYPVGTNDYSFFEITSLTTYQQTTATEVWNGGGNTTFRYAAAKYKAVLGTGDGKGSSIGYVVSSTGSVYPMDGVQGSYWYVSKGLNNAPTMSVNSSGDKTLYNDGGVFSIAGTITDIDNDSVVISAIIGGVTKSTTVTSTSITKNWTLTWSGSELPVGIYTNSTVTATDGKESTSVAYSGKLTIQAQIYYYWSKFNTYSDYSPVKAVFEEEASIHTGNQGGLTKYTIDGNGVFTLSDEKRYFGENISVYAYYDNTHKVVQRADYYGSVSSGTYYKVMIYRLTASDPGTPVNYFKSNLVQANIKAAQNTYPLDGIYTDGFWYVRSGTVPNNLPTATVTQSGNKTINLKTGSDTFTISGNATDADNETLSVSAAINGVIKQVAVSNTGTAKPWTLTWRTSEFPIGGDFSNPVVTIDDGRGGVATVTYTGTITVNKTPLFYWDKYSVNNTPVYKESKWNFLGYSENSGRFYGYNAYTLDKNNGKFSANGKKIDIMNAEWGSIYWHYGDSNETLYRDDFVSIYGQQHGVNTNSYALTATSEIVKNKGTLVTANILDIDKTYPDNGIYSDGYWYVKKATTNMPPVITVDNSDINVSLDKPDLVLTGTVIDTDGDMVTGGATISGVTKTGDQPSSATPIPWKLTWLGSELKDGTYTSIPITVTDGKGGTDTTIYTGTIIVDRIVPTAPTITTDSIGWVNHNVLVTVEPGTDTGSGVREVQYSLDGTTWAKYTTPVIVSTEGLTTFQAKTVDIVGNKSIAAINEIKIDKTPPIPPVVTLSKDGWSTADVSVAVVAGSDTLSGVASTEYKIESGVWTPYTTSFEVSDNGTTRGSVRTTDNAGNVSQSTLFEVKIDKVPPEINFSGDTGTWSTSPIDVTVSLTGGHSGVDVNERKYKITTSPIIPSSWDTLDSDTKTFTFDTEGRWYLHSKLKNQAGVEVVSVSQPILYQLAPQPTTLTSSAVGADSVELHWVLSPSSFHEGYKYRIENVTTGAVIDLTHPTDSTTLTGLSAGSNYSFHATVVNNVGESLPSNTVDILTLPAAVTSLIVHTEDYNSDSVAFSFDTVTSADSYEVVLKETQSGQVVNSYSVTDTVYNPLSDVQTGTQYTLDVTAKNATGRGKTSSISFLSLPASPGDFKSVVIRETEIELSWLPTDTSTGYEIVRDTFGSWDRVFYDNQTSFTDTGLTASTVYGYGVSAENDTGFGNYAYLNGLLTLPSKVTTLSADNFTSTGFRLSWDSVAGATGYSVTLAGVTVDVVTDTTLDLSGLSSGTQYIVGVSARNATGNGAEIVGTYKTIPEDLTPGVAGLTVVSTSETSAEITWNTVTGADKFKVEVNGQELILSGTTATINGLSGGTEYTLLLSGGNESGFGGSTSIGFLTLPSAPSDITTIAVTPDSFTMSWTAVVGADGYIVYDDQGTVLDTISETTWTYENIGAGASATVSVSAVNDSGVGAKASYTQRVLPASWGVAPDGSSPIKVGFTTTDSVELIWDSVTGADGYNVYDGSGKLVVTVLEPDTSVLIDNLISATDHIGWSVVPINTTGEGVGATVPTFVTKPLDNYTIIVEPNVHDVTFKIDSLMKNESYVVTLDGKEKYRGKDTTFTVGGLVSEKEYTFLVSTENSIGDTTPVKDVLVTTLVDLEAIEKATDAVGKTESTLDKKDLDDAQTLVDQLVDGAVKNELQDRLDAVEEILSKIDEATKSVIKAEASNSQKDVDAAHKLVDGLPSGEAKTDLTNRLDAVQKIIDEMTKIDEATKAVVKSEKSKSQSDVDDAHKLVDALPSGETKTDLTNRLDAVQKIIDEMTKIDEATKAVVKAEKSKSQSDVDAARKLVEKLVDGTVKTGLTKRLDAIQKEIEDAKNSGGSGNGGGSSGNGTKPVLPETPKVTEPDKGGESSNGSHFNDVGSNSFAKEAINYLTDEGIIKGVTDKMYEPNREITRMEFAALIVRAIKAGPDNALEITYKDINKDSWYMGELNAAIANNVAIGFSENEFRPLSKINREQSAMMLGNILIDKYGLSETDTPINFSDNKNVADWADKAVRVISGNNIIEGYPDGSFRPKSLLTRAESAVLIYRMLQKKI